MPKKIPAPVTFYVSEDPHCASDLGLPPPSDMLRYDNAAWTGRHVTDPEEGRSWWEMVAKGYPGVQPQVTTKRWASFGWTAISENDMRNRFGA